LTPLTPQQKLRRAKRKAKNPTPEMKRVSDLCRDVQKKHGWGLRGLAEEMNVRIETIWRWVHCKGHLPTPENIKKLEELQNAR
jgi:ribosome-binding protein aMBF1 (putative translation factor)